MDWKDFLADIPAYLEIVIPIASLAASVAIFNSTVQRDRKLSTLKIVDEIRMAFPTVQNLSNQQIKKYLRKMEFLCTGINEGIYDLRIMRKTSGRLFLSQYNIVKPYITSRRSSGRQIETVYTEYEQVMKELYCFYNCTPRGWRRWFCKKR